MAEVALPLTIRDLARDDLAVRLSSPPGPAGDRRERSSLAATGRVLRKRARSAVDDRLPGQRPAADHRRLATSGPYEAAPDPRAAATAAGRTRRGQRRGPAPVQVELGYSDPPLVERARRMGVPIGELPGAGRSPGPAGGAAAPTRGDGGRSQDGRDAPVSECHGVLASPQPPGCGSRSARWRASSSRPGRGRPGPRYEPRGTWFMPSQARYGGPPAGPRNRTRAAPARFQGRAARIRYARGTGSLARPRCR